MNSMLWFKWLRSGSLLISYKQPQCTVDLIHLVSCFIHLQWLFICLQKSPVCLFPWFVVHFFVCLLTRNYCCKSFYCWAFDGGVGILTSTGNCDGVEFDMFILAVIRYHLSFSPNFDLRAHGPLSRYRIW